MLTATPDLDRTIVPSPETSTPIGKTMTIIIISYGYYSTDTSSNLTQIPDSEAMCDNSKIGFGLAITFIIFLLMTPESKSMDLYNSEVELSKTLQ